LHGSYAWTDTLKGVYYGPGSVATALPKLLHTLGVKKALVVTGRSLYTKVIVRVVSCLPNARLICDAPDRLMS
jgi:alcohol dehydrogenase class IV